MLPEWAPFYVAGDIGTHCALLKHNSLFSFFKSKEKLINSLKEGSGFEGVDSSTASSMELEELRHEKDMQREEIQRLMGQIQQLRSELQVRAQRPGLLPAHDPDPGYSESTAAWPPASPWP